MGDKAPPALKIDSAVTNSFHRNKLNALIKEFQRFVRPIGNFSNYPPFKMKAGPMLRKGIQPLDPGILHGDVRVEDLGDSVGDEGGTLLLEQFDQPLLLRHQCINLPRLPLQKLGDDMLFMLRWHWDVDTSDCVSVEVELCA